MKDGGRFVVVVTVRVRGDDAVGPAPTEPEPVVCVQTASLCSTSTSRTSKIERIQLQVTLTPGAWR